MTSFHSKETLRWLRLGLIWSAIAWLPLCGGKITAAELSRSASVLLDTNLHPGFLVTNIINEDNISNADTVSLALDAPTQTGYWHHVKVTFGTTTGSPQPFAIYSLDKKLAVKDSGSAFGLPIDGSSAVLVRRYDLPFDGTANAFSGVAPDFPIKGQVVYFGVDEETQKPFTGPVTLKLKAAGTGANVKWKYTIQAYYRSPLPDELAAPIPEVVVSKSVMMSGDTLDLDITASPSAGSTVNRVEIFDNDTHVGNAAPTGVINKWTYKIENIGAGHHRLKARVVDQLGRSAFSEERVDTEGKKGTKTHADWFLAKINFQPASLGSAPPLDAAYIKDTGTGFTEHSGVEPSQRYFYGWSRELSPLSGLQRNELDSDERFDTYALMRDASGGKTDWEIQVPPGRYSVQLCVGDSGYGGERYELEIENERKIVTTTKTVRTGWHEIIDVPVSVLDGRLTIRDVGKERTAKLNYVVVRQLASPIEYKKNPWVDAARGGYPNVITVRSLGGLRAASSPSDYALSRYDSLRPMVFFCANNAADQESAFHNHSGLVAAPYAWTSAGAGAVASFGAEFSAGRIYQGQTYAFAVYAGAIKKSSEAEFRIRVFSAATNIPVGTMPLQLDDMIDAGCIGWVDALRRGLSSNFSDTVLGIDVTISRSYANLTYSNPTWTLRLSAGNPDYIYLLEANSIASAYDSDTDSVTVVEPALALTRFATVGAGDLYTLAESAYTPVLALRPEVTVAFASQINQHAFEGELMPSTYYGLSADEVKNKHHLDTSLAVHTLDASPVNISAITNPDDAALTAFKKIGSKLLNSDPWQLSSESPELRQHTLLDEFIKRYNSDPIALANYVQNEIELSDAISYNQEYEDGVPSIYPGGVQRGALGVLLEKQGSPAEQCALLVYFLRNCRIPAAYVRTTRNQLLMADSEISRLLEVRLANELGIPELVPVNYPWVMALVPKEENPAEYRWIHLFPWIKDIELTEGQDLYANMPPDFDSGWKWAYKYFRADPEVLPYQLRDSDGPGPVEAKIVKVYGNNAPPYNQVQATLPREYEDVDGRQDFDQPALLWPRLVESKLRLKNLTLDDVGYRVRMRNHLYGRWQDFPTPTQVKGNFTALSGLKQIPNIFDTIRYQITQVANGADTAVILDTNPMLLCDVLNRKIYIERYNVDATDGDDVRLTVGKWDPFETSASADQPTPMTDQLVGANFVKGVARHVTKIADPSPGGTLRVRIVHDRDRGNLGLRNLSGYFPEDGSLLTNAFHASRYIQNTSVPGLQEIDTNNLPKGVNALCVHVGRVTQDMLFAHLREIWAYEQNLPATPNRDIVHGTKAFLMGMSYWQYITDFNERLTKLHKISIVSDYGHLFAGLGYSLQVQKPVVPTIDIYRTTTMGHLFSASLNPVRFDEYGPDEANSYDDLIGCQGSAYEHGVIDRYFGSLGAISTMRIFHIAKDREDNAPAAEKNSHKIIELTQDNYAAKLATVSLFHEAQGPNVSNPANLLNSNSLSYFYSSIKSLLEPSGSSNSELERRKRAAVLYMAPGFYKYYHKDGIMLESAGLAPVPALGRMGGLIQAREKYAHFTYIASITQTAEQTERYADFIVNGQNYSSLGEVGNPIDVPVDAYAEFTLVVAPDLFDTLNNKCKEVKAWKWNGVNLGTGINDSAGTRNSMKIRVDRNGIVTANGVATAINVQLNNAITVELDDPLLTWSSVTTPAAFNYTGSVSTSLRGASLYKRSPQYTQFSPLVFGPYGEWYSVRVLQPNTAFSTDTTYVQVPGMTARSYKNQYQLRCTGWKDSVIVQMGPVTDARYIYADGNWSPIFNF